MLLKQTKNQWHRKRTDINIKKCNEIKRKRNDTKKDQISIERNAQKIKDKEWIKRNEKKKRIT